MENFTAQLSERVQALEQRQAALSRSNRRLRLTFGGTLLLVAAAFLMGQTDAGSRSVEAEQFVVRDSAGKVRGAMGLGETGTVGISLNDNQGKTRITLDLAPDGSPGFDLYDQTGKLRATIALGPHGTPGIGLYDADGKLRTSLDVPAAKTPGLAFYHSNGNPAWGVP